MCVCVCVCACVLGLGITLLRRSSVNIQLPESEPKASALLG